MNSFPFYAVWSTKLGTWFGGSLKATRTTDKQKAIDFVNNLQSPWYGHQYQVIEIWGESHYDKVIYETPEYTQ